MSNFNRFTEEQSLTVLRLLVLTRLLINTSGISLERMQDYLRKKRLRVSARQLQRDLRALTIPLSLTSQSNEEGTCNYWWSKDAEASHWQKSKCTKASSTSLSGPSLPPQNGQYAI